MKNLAVLILFLLNFTTIFAKDLQHVSLQLNWKHQFEYAGFYMAKEKGFYKDVGLDVTIKEYDSDTDIVDDVQSEKTTFGVGYPSLVLDKSLGADIVLLGTVLQSSPHVLISLKSSNIKSIKDFKGKKIMINIDATKTASFSAMLQRNNISFDDMQIVPPSFNIDDLINKKVDLITAFTSNELYKLDQLGIKYDIWDPKEYGFDFYSVIGFTSGKFLQRNRNIVLKYKKASKKGWLYAFDHIDEAVDLILKKYNSQNKTREALKYEANVLKELAFYDNNEFGKIDPNKIQRIFDMYVILGVTKKQLNMNTFIFNKYTTSLNDEEKEYLSENRVIRMCNNPNWEPIEFRHEGVMQGIAIDNMYLIEKKLGVKIKSIPTNSWAESQQFLKEKKCDILPAAIKTEKREKYAKFTTPYLKYKLAIVTTKDKPFVNSVEHLVKEGKTIARKKASGLIHKLKEQYDDVKIIETKGYTESFQKVSKGEAYCTIATLPIIAYNFQKFALNNLQISGYTDMEYRLSIAVRDDAPMLLNIMDKTLQTMTFKEQSEIYDKWANTEITQKIDYTYFIYFVLFIVVVMVLVLIKQSLLSRQNRLLCQMVDERTKELKTLNESLEHRIQDETKKNRQNELRLQEQSKMAAMGEMIGNIAHQWRQPLSFISTAATGMRVKKEMEMLQDEEFFEYCDKINENSQYLSQTIDDFRNFIKGDTELTDFDLKKDTNSFIKLMDGTIKAHNILVVLELHDDLQIQGYPSELIQCFINIFNNAKDAFVLNETHEEERYVFISQKVESSQIIIKFKDSAGGIPKEVLPKVFEPYFTTKHKSQGTGLGLHMSYNLIVQMMGGDINVKNVEYEFNDKSYKGAEFTITLPLG